MQHATQPKIPSDPKEPSFLGEFIMSRTVKIILGIGAFFLVACCGIVAIIAYVVPTAITSVAENSFTESAVEAAEVGQSMLNYTLPSGFEETAAMDLGFKMVLIESQNTPTEPMIIMMMEFPSFLVDQDEMITEMRRTAAEQTGTDNLNVQSTSTEEIIINGEAVTLTTVAGTDDEGNVMRQLMAPFASESGGAGMLMLMGSDENWNGDAAGTFLNSIRE